MVLVLAQYLSARYIFALDENWEFILFNKILFFLILSSILAIAAGYLINNFFDADKDKINRPYTFLIEQKVSPQFQLSLYFIFNSLCLLIAWSVSFKTVVFYTGYIFGIWLYSFFLKRTFWISNLFISMLAIVPFFVLTLYFKNFSAFIFFHALFLFLVLLIKDLVKDLENYQGDWANHYKTFAVTFGIKKTKATISVVILTTFIPIYILFGYQNELQSMIYYFIITPFFLLCILLLTWQSSSKRRYLLLHNTLKILILMGVLSIVLIRFPLQTQFL